MTIVVGVVARATTVAGAIVGDIGVRCAAAVVVSLALVRGFDGGGESRHRIVIVKIGRAHV